MAYRRYVARVERRRALLAADLVKANKLRLEANLPLWDSDKELAEREPLLTEDTYLAKGSDQRAFARFRRQHLAKVGVLPTRLPDAPHNADDWERNRADGYRRVFQEHQIQQAWLAKARADSSPTDQGQAGC